MSFTIPLVYAAIIMIGMLGRIFKLFNADAPTVLSKAVLYLTLPAAVISVFKGFERDSSLFVLIAIGFFASFLPFIISYFASRRLTANKRAYYMLNTGGFNIGCFSLPVVTGLFSAAVAPSVCLFDIGNALMMTGGSFAATSCILKLGKVGNPFIGVAKRLFSSVAFDTYLLMLIFLLFNIRLPNAIYDLLAPIASANGFLAMLTVGAMFDPSGIKLYFKSALIVCLIRLAWGSVLASIFYICLPFTQPIRIALAVAAFSPVSALAPIFSQKVCGEGARSGFTLSMSVIFSLLCMLIFTSIVFFNE